MSGKKAKQAKGWPCPGCGKKLGKRATSCSRCGRLGGPGALRSTKSALAYLAKAARGAVAQCGSCSHSQPPGSRYCSACGQVMPGALGLVSKSGYDARLSDQFRRTVSPGEREVLWKAMHPDITKGGGAA